MKTSTIAAALTFVIGSVNSAFAGTYSIVNGSMSAAPTTGAYAHAPNSGSYWEVSYGASASHQFSGSYPDGANKQSGVSPTYTWRVRWVPSYPGETPPVGPVPAKAKSQGFAYAHIYMHTILAGGGSQGTFYAQVSSVASPLVSAYVSRSNPPTPPNGLHVEDGSTTYDDTPDLFMETGYFTQVSPGVWEADMSVTLMASVQLTCTNNPTPVKYTIVEADGQVASRVRPVEIGGQTIAPGF